MCWFAEAIADVVCRKVCDVELRREGGNERDNNVWEGVRADRLVA